MRRAAKTDESKAAIVEAIEAEGWEVCSANAMDLTGRKVGLLSVQKPCGRRNGEVLWMCQCQCGNSSVRRTSYLLHSRSKTARSCGCARLKTSRIAVCMLCNQRFISKIRRERDCYEKYCSHLCANRAKDFKGAKNPNWKDDATSRNGRGRLSSAYVKWKRSVLDRDNHTCVYCGSKDRVQADHQEPWALFPESRFEVNNGQALCLSCHTRKTIHQRMHKAKKRDINEIEIVMAIREEGWDVYRLDEPCDLLCWHPVLSILQWLEVKTIHEGRKKPAVDKRQESQRKFLARTSCPIVTTPDEAFEVLCRHYPSDVARPDLVLMAKRIRDEFERSWKARAAA